MSNIAVFPGSFDPITNGHLDIAIRCSKIFDKVIVGVLDNSKKTPLFSVSERIDMIAKCVIQYSNIFVSSFNGLLVDFMRKNDAKIIIRGVRSVTDFEYEFQISQVNKYLDKNIETFFMITDAKYSYISSSTVKELIKYKGDISELVPPIVVNALKEKSVIDE